MHGDMSSKIIYIEDVWDEFNYGISSPHALRSFLTYAWRNWQVGPRYVVLAGDGTIDYKDTLGFGGNLIAPMMVSTPHGLFPSDSRLGDVDPASAAAEIAVGRLPAIDEGELNLIINRIESRVLALADPELTQLVLAADDPDEAGDFPFDSERIAGLAPPGSTVDRVYLPDMTVVEARQRILGALNAGADFMSYIGHGGFDSYAAEGMFRASDLALWTSPDRPAVIAAMTCNVGHFALTDFPCLSELMLRNVGGGAAAVWSPTGMSENELAVVLAEAFWAEVFSNRPRIGDAILAASRAYEADGLAPYTLDIYNLLGDPAMKLY